MTYSNGVTTKTYAVSRIGSDGADGTPGAAGANGKTSYVHFAYAKSADGNTGFSTTYFSGALYVGTCTDFNTADPTSYTAYTWARLKGEDGAPGNGIKKHRRDLSGKHIGHHTAHGYVERFYPFRGCQSVPLDAHGYNLHGQYHIYIVQRG